MLFVLLNWAYIGITAFLAGFTVLMPFRKTGPEEERGYACRTGTGIFMAGLAFVTVYAEGYSLFAGVGLAANLGLLVFCAVSAIVLRRQLSAFIREKWQESGPGGRLFAAVLVLLMAYGTSRGYMHVDTGLYHAQAIRWIEEYGVVPGLGNLHSRFAYNSAAFPLCAIYGMRWAAVGSWTESMHAVQGFLALLVGIQCCGLGRLVRRKRVLVSDFVRLGAVYYLTVLFREMVSPASDYFAMLFLFYILIAWLDLLERREASVVPYALLSLLLVFTVTVKLSAAVMLLLVLKPAVLLLKGKRWKEIALYIGLGILISLPWLIRGGLISGWLFYPFTFLDVFPVDWKLEKGYADCDSKEIQVFARLLYDVNLYDTPFTSWAGNWFASLKGLEKLWVAASAGCTVLGMAAIGRAALLLKNNGCRAARSPLMFRKKAGDTGGIAAWDWILYASVLIIGYFFWQFSAPLIRYGYVYVLMLPTAVLGYGYVYLTEKNKRLERMGCYAFAAGASVFLLIKGSGLAGGIAETAGEPYYIRQQGYGSFAAITYEVDGVTIYVPADGGQIGYDKFPSSPRIQDIELRGEGAHAGDLRYGFRAQ